MLSLCLAFATFAQTAEAAPAKNGFKFPFRELDVAGKTLHSGEILVRDGRWFRVRSLDDEILIVDPKRRKIDVVNLVRKTRSEIGFDRLDENIGRLKRSIGESIAKREAEGGRANVVAAKMARDLLEPAFKPVRDPSGRSSKLANETVEIEVAGEPDPDAERVAALGLVLTQFAKLESARNPTRIPPFPEIAAVEETTKGLKLRPVELVYVYRLAGKPIKLSWRYRFVPSLTERESLAMGRIVEALGLAKAQRFEDYERDRK